MSVCLSICLSVCLRLYTHIHLHIHIYIYIERERDHSTMCMYSRRRRRPRHRARLLPAAEIIFLLWRGRISVRRGLPRDSGSEIPSVQILSLRIDRRLDAPAERGSRVTIIVYGVAGQGLALKRGVLFTDTCILWAETINCQRLHVHDTHVCINMCVYVSVYIYIYIYIYIYMCIINMCVCVYVCLSLSIYIYIYIHTHA